LDGTPLFFISPLPFFNFPRSDVLILILISFSVICILQENGVVSYVMPQNLLEYVDRILRKDFESAAPLLPTIAKSCTGVLSKFLQGQGLFEMALTISDDPETKFQLAHQLQSIDKMVEIARESEYPEEKWAKIGEIALSSGDMDTAEMALWACKDYSGLLTYYTSFGNKNGMLKLADATKSGPFHNLNFLVNFQLGRLDECLNILIKTGKVAEATLFARTYVPSHVHDVLEQWKKELLDTGKPRNAKTAEALADPPEYPNMFPDWEIGLKAEELYEKQQDVLLPATKYPEVKESMDWMIIDELKEMNLEEEEIHPDQDDDSDEEEEEDIDMPTGKEEEDIDMPTGKEEEGIDMPTGKDDDVEDSQDEVVEEEDWGHDEDEDKDKEIIEKKSE
jgi:coatomer subunit beta'